MVEDEPMTMLELSDLMISRVRKESGLWYDVNEGVWEPEYVNQAQITDGSSFLLLWISSSQPPYDSWIQLDHYIGPLFIAWQNRHDSRREFDESFFRKVAASVIADSPTQLERGYSLLSFQLTGSSPIGHFEHVMLRQLPFGAIRGLPTYNGMLCDSPNFQMSEDPYAKWCQLEFDSPIASNTLISGLSELVAHGSVTLETNKSYESSAALQQVGVDRLEVFGRKW